jgi:hypothetical protein
MLAGWLRANDGNAKVERNSAAILQSLIFISPSPPRKLK